MMRYRKLPKRAKKFVPPYQLWLALLIGTAILDWYATLLGLWLANGWAVVAAAIFGVLGIASLILRGPDF